MKATITSKTCKAAREGDLEKVQLLLPRFLKQVVKKSEAEFEYRHDEYAASILKKDVEEAFLQVMMEASNFGRLEVVRYLESQYLDLYGKSNCAGR